MKKRAFLTASSRFTLTISDRSWGPAQFNKQAICFQFMWRNLNQSYHTVAGIILLQYFSRILEAAGNNRRKWLLGNVSTADWIACNSPALLAQLLDCWCWYVTVGADVCFLVKICDCCCRCLCLEVMWKLAQVLDSWWSYWRDWLCFHAAV